MPRACATWDKSLALESGIGADVRKALEAKGHTITDGRGPMGGYQAIFIDPKTGVLLGGSDLRKDGLRSGGEVKTLCYTDETRLQRIVPVDQERVFAGNPGRAFDLGDDRRSFTDLDAIDDAATERRADDALVNERHVVQQQSHVVEHRHHRGGAGAARRSIDFGIREDRDVAQMRIRQMRRRGEDRAVDAFEARVVGVHHAAQLLDFARDRHAELAQLRQVRGVDRHARRLGVDNRVERAAERDVDGNLAAADRHHQRRLEHKRRHVAERHRVDAHRFAVMRKVRARLDETGRRVVANVH